LTEDMGTLQVSTDFVDVVEVEPSDGPDISIFQSAVTGLGLEVCGYSVIEGIDDLEVVQGEAVLEVFGEEGFTAAFDGRLQYQGVPEGEVVLSGEACSLFEEVIGYRAVTDERDVEVCLKL
jgi:hypothetical protein